MCQALREYKLQMRNACSVRSDAKAFVHRTARLIRALARLYGITCFNAHHHVATDPLQPPVVLNRRNWCRSVGAVQRPLNDAPTPRVGGKQAGSQASFVFVL